MTEANQSTASGANQAANQAQAQATAAGNTHEFKIRRLYVKDLSFEVPHAPEVFNQEWDPELSFDLHTSADFMGEQNHEVTVSLTITAKVEEKVAFLIEVKHAGIFTIKGYEGEQLHAVLGSVCPGIIFPYLREVVSEMVLKGGFPNLYLDPINFDALYAQHLQQQAEGEQAAEQPAE